MKQIAFAQQTYAQLEEFFNACKNKCRGKSNIANHLIYTNYTI